MTPTTKTYEERVAEVSAKREAEYDRLRKLDKPALLREISSVYRIHSCDQRMSKRDLIYAVLDARFLYPRAPR